MRILIAGCGDVGGVLAVALLREGHEVYGLKRDISSLPEGVKAIEADLTNPNTLKDIPEGIDQLVFMPTPASRDQAGYEAIFIQGWKNIWAALKQAPIRTLLVSSTAVFGESDGGCVNEETLPGPTGFNGKVLLKMEQLAADCTDKLVVVRISGIYGPGRERLVRLAASNDLEIQKSPPYYTNRIHRDDAATALKHLLEIDKPEDLYIASDNLSAPRYEVVEWLARAQGKPAPVAVTTGQSSRGKRVSNKKLRNSGFILSYPDYRAGYGSILNSRK